MHCHATFHFVRGQKTQIETPVHLWPYHVTCFLSSEHMVLLPVNQLISQLMGLSPGMYTLMKATKEMLMISMQLSSTHFMSRLVL